MTPKDNQRKINSLLGNCCQNTFEFLPCPPSFDIVFQVVAIENSKASIVSPVRTVFFLFCLLCTTVQENNCMFFGIKLAGKKIPKFARWIYISETFEYKEAKMRYLKKQTRKIIGSKSLHSHVYFDFIMIALRI